MLPRESTWKQTADRLPAGRAWIWVPAKNHINGTVGQCGLPLAAMLTGYGVCDRGCLWRCAHLHVSEKSKPWGTPRTEYGNSRDVSRTTDSDKGWTLLVRLERKGRQRRAEWSDKAPVCSNCAAQHNEKSREFTGGREGGAPVISALWWILHGS